MHVHKDTHSIYSKQMYYKNNIPRTMKLTNVHRIFNKCLEFTERHSKQFNVPQPSSSLPSLQSASPSHMNFSGINVKLPSPLCGHGQLPFPSQVKAKMKKGIIYSKT